MDTAWVASIMGWSTTSSPVKGLCTSASVAPQRNPWRRRRYPPAIAANSPAQSLFGAITSSPLATGGWSRQPVGHGGPHYEEVKCHRQQFRGSEEAHHQDERKDGSSPSERPPPAEWDPPPHHRQRREDKHQCCTPGEPDSDYRVFARGGYSAQEPAVADRPGPSPPQQPAELPLRPAVQGNEVRSGEVRLQHQKHREEPFHLLDLLMTSTWRSHTTSRASPAAAITPSVGTARFAARGESTSSNSGTGSPRRSCNPPSGQSP